MNNQFLCCFKATLFILITNIVVNSIVKIEELTPGISIMKDNAYCPNLFTHFLKSKKLFLKSQIDDKLVEIKEKTEQESGTIQGNYIITYILI